MKISEEYVYNHCDDAILLVIDTYPLKTDLRSTIACTAFSAIDLACRDADEACLPMADSTRRCFFDDNLSL